MNRRLRNRGACIANGGVILGALFLFCGCASTHTHAKSGEEQEASSTMPDALIGVWHRNDDEGRESCDSYKAVRSVNEITEESSALIGGLIIIEDMVHAYSEYGEGNFYAVKNVVNLGRQSWKVDALVYIDTMPTEEEYAAKSTLNFVIESELLSVNEMNTFEGSKDESKFFRCGEVIDGLYENQADATASPREVSAADPIQVDSSQKFEGEWSYHNDCDHGHYVTLEFKREKDLLVGFWSDGTLLRGSQGLVRGRVDQGRLVAEWCSDSEQAGAPALCPSYEPSDDYLVARDGVLAWYQKYGQDYVEYVVLKQGIKSHKSMKACEKNEKLDDGSSRS